MPRRFVPEDVIKHRLLPDAFISLPGPHQRRQQRPASFGRKKGGRRVDFTAFGRVIFTAGSARGRYPGSGAPKGEELAACLSVTGLLLK